jgi:hypothetical protein
MGAFSFSKNESFSTEREISDEKFIFLLKNVIFHKKKHLFKCIYGPPH